jgi:hypothetical protein
MQLLLQSRIRTPGEGWSKPVITNLGYAYPQGYEPGHLGVCEKNY